MGKSKTEVHKEILYIFKKYNINKTDVPQYILYGHLDWFLAFLLHRIFMGIMLYNFDIFKIYKRYQRVMPFIAFFIKADKNGL
jgi:uncharacterized membrane protein YkvI